MDNQNIAKLPKALVDHNVQLQKLNMEAGSPSRLQQFNSRLQQTRSLHLRELQRQAEPHTNDTNDPRNWPTWQKALTYGTICVFSFMANVNASSFTIAVVPLIRALHISATQGTALTAYLLLTFGFGNLLWVPLMRVIGKRPVYLLALILLIATNAWSARSTTYSSLLASRIVSGIGAAAADATVPSVVTDLYGQNVRGSTLMIFNFSLSSGIFLSPLINAWVIQLHGWRWVPGWMSIAFGVIFLLAIFTIHETEYRRPRQMYNLAEMPARRTFKSYLSLTSSFQPRGQRILTLLRSFKDILWMTIYPPIFYSATTIGLFVGWAVIIQITAGTTLTRPPYSFALGDVGLFHISGWLGTIPAIIAGGLLVDYASRRDVKRHVGSARSPAEERLKALVIPALIAPAGLIVYGVCFAREESWIGPAFGYAMHSFGFVGVANILITYALDGYTKYSGEGLVSLFIIRNIIAMVCSFYCNVWIARDGMVGVFGTTAGLEWALLLLGLPVWFWNNRLLGFTRGFGPAARGEAMSNEERAEDVETMNRPVERAEV